MGKDKCGEKRKAAKEIHRNVFCDGCHANPSNRGRAKARGTVCGPRKNGWIKGPRFKSQSTYDFDLCATCHESKAFEATHGPFARIPPKKCPFFAPAKAAETSSVPNVHANVLCDCCEDDASGEARKQAVQSGSICPQTGHIVGVRYKSAVREDYDLCSSCEASIGSAHSAAPFLKISKPSQRPSAIFCVLENEHPSRGGSELKAGSDPNWRRSARQKFRQFMRSSRGHRACSPQRKKHPHCGQWRRNGPMFGCTARHPPRHHPRTHPPHAPSLQAYIASALNGDAATLSEDEANVELAKAIEASIHT